MENLREKDRTQSDSEDTRIQQAIEKLLTLGQETKDSSEEIIRAALDSIRLEEVTPENRNRLRGFFKAMLDPARFGLAKSYLEKESKLASQIVASIAPVLTPMGEIDFIKKTQQYFALAQRLLKVYRMAEVNLSDTEKDLPVFEQAEDQSDEEKIEELEKISREGLVSSYEEMREAQRKAIDALPNDEEGLERLQNLIDLLKTLGLLKPFGEEIAKKKSRMPRESPISTKRKKRIIGRLIRGISIATLPLVSEDQIKEEGGHFKLFKALEQQNLAWMNLSLQKYVFGSNAAKLNEFESAARKTESASEENQINYLKANRSWALSYIKSDSDGVLTDREEANYVAQLENMAEEKEREIKNYFLTRDFSMGSVKGIQIKPEVRLPLYVSVKLAVSEKDKIKESPLRNLLGGVVSIASGLFSMVPDKIDQAALAQAKARNQAIVGGIDAIIKGTIGLVGGKQAARDYEQGVETLGKTLDPERLSIDKKGKAGKTMEDMLSITDSPGFTPVNPEAPGQLMQTPDSMAGSMDILALAGPLKKEAPKKKKKENSIQSFADFVKTRAKK